MATDILQEMSINDIIELKQIYKSCQDDAPYVHSFLQTALKWNETNPDYITIYSVRGQWREDGTFIALLKFSCFDLLVYSLDNNGELLFQGLTQTKNINWAQQSILFYALHEKFAPIVRKALKRINVAIDSETVTNLWQISESAALQINDDFRFENDLFYMDRIKEEDASTINDRWPPKYDGSLEYLRVFIKLNGGYGIYEKSSGKLVSWILHNVIGQLGVLQTREGYFRNNFATIVTKKLTREIAKQGNHVAATIHDGNIPSEKLFANLGFIKRFKSLYITTNVKC